MLVLLKTFVWWFVKLGYIFMLDKKHIQKNIVSRGFSLRVTFLSKALYSTVLSQDDSHPGVFIRIAEMLGNLT